MELSKRLQAVADYVTPGLRVADVGTDHGYIPIFLVKTGITPSAVAMDINRGPLERADAHIKMYGLQDRIKTRLSDGINALLPKEAECIVIAGMGGGLMIHILNQDMENIREIKEWIFEPQSEVEEFRAYLHENGFDIIKENMIEEDGKFYPIMKAVKGQRTQGENKLQCRYGALLLKEKNPVLKEYLLNEKRIKESILSSLKSKSGDRILKRISELELDLQLNAEALERYQ